MKRSVMAIVALCVASLMVFALSGCQSSSYTPTKKDSTIKASALVKKGTLTVGVNASNAPFATQQDGSIVGIDVDTAAALADQMGLDLKLVDVGSDPSSALADKKVDIVMGIKQTDTGVDAWLSDTYLDTATALFANDENVGMPSSKSTTTIAAQTNSASASLVINQFGSDYLSSTQDLASAFSNLDGGTVKYAAADAVVGSYLVHASNYKAKIVGLLDKPSGYCIGVRSSNTAMKTEVANALGNIQDQGIMGVIEQKWFGSTLDLSNVAQSSSAKSEQATSSSSTASSSASGSSSGSTSSNNGSGTGTKVDGLAGSSSGSSSGSSDGGSVSNVGANAASFD